MAVTLFASQNEHVVLPHTHESSTQAIKLSTMAEEPMNGFLLFRSLFRSIGGGKFEHIYKEILPLLEMMLDVLNSLLHTARKPQDRDLFVELSRDGSGTPQQSDPAHELPDAAHHPGFE